MPRAWRCGQGVGNLKANQQSAFQIERMPVHELAHVAALDVLHGDEVMPFSFIEIEDGADVWMIERRGEPRFAFETPQVGFARGQLRPAGL